MYTMGGAFTFLSVESMACLGGFIVVERERTKHVGDWTTSDRGAMERNPCATGERAVVKTRRVMTANRDAMVVFE